MGVQARVHALALRMTHLVLAMGPIQNSDLSTNAFRRV